MTRTGSPDLWRIGEPLGVVPSPPDPVLARLLADWWTVDRTFGCATARTSNVWCVVMPSPSILCPICAAEAYAAERRCGYCARPVRRSRAVTLLFELGDYVRVLGFAHRHCQEEARR